MLSPFHTHLSLPCLVQLSVFCKNPKSSRVDVELIPLQGKTQIYTAPVQFSLCAFQISNAWSTHIASVSFSPALSSLQGIPTRAQPSTASPLSHYTNVRNM